MVSSRTATAIAGLVGSVLLSVVLWWYFDTVAVFLFLPFVPFLFRRSEQESREERLRICPTCGFQTRNDAYDYCPRDGTRLERPKR